MSHKESTLKKEFTKKEVSRMRNLITGKSGDSTQVLAGYQKIEEDHKEGDIWRDSSGKSWTIKNGIKQSVTKLDKLKKLVVLPLTCPCCKKTMKVNDLNKKMYSIHEMCLDCVVVMEDRIKREGKWEEYTSEKLTSNKNSSLVDFEKAVQSWHEDKEQFFSEAGDMESWSQGDKSKVYDEIKTKLEELKNIKL